jgi:hypothetical protein
MPIDLSASGTLGVLVVNSESTLFTLRTSWDCCPNKTEPRTELTNVTLRSGIPGLRIGYCPQSYGSGSLQGPGLAAFLFRQHTLELRTSRVGIYLSSQGRNRGSRWSDQEVLTGSPLWSNENVMCTGLLTLSHIGE